jgi:nucleoside-diphosphate-sugar epimerase
MVLTGFEPKYCIREGSEKIVEWFTKPQKLAKYKPRIYNL